MPKLTSSLPKYRRHKASGQAVVTLSGTDFYLGVYGTKASRDEYDRVVGEWSQNGRRIVRGTRCDLAVVEILAAYQKHADSYYVKDGKRTREAEIITEVFVAYVQPLYGRLPAIEFGPRALQHIREKMIEAGHSRSYINKNIDRIRRCFRWAAAEEMVPASISQALQTLAGLRKGRSRARDYPPVRPVEQAVVDATLPHLTSVVADMVRFQRLTGARPGEVCQLRPADVDRSQDVWRYVPESHKCEHHDQERIIFIGPKAQDVLRCYLLRPADAYCFSPAESEKHRLESRHTARRTPPSCGNKPGSNRKPRPKRQARSRYTKDSYNRAIKRGCEAAFTMPKELRYISKKLDVEDRNRLQKLAAGWRAEHCWSPNQLRHAAGTEIRRHYGLEAAQVVLGHAKADVTQVYAERDMELAKQIAKEVG